MDAEIAKLTQKLLTKQGMKFKLNTKVTQGDDSGETVKINTEAAKGGKEEVVSKTVKCIEAWTNSTSSMRTLSWSLSVADHTQQALD